jgi:branched-chain amino acid transport system ATP-binding protein
MSALLEISGLVSGYGDTTVLHGIDLTVEEGEVVAILGRNGMGKTTLMHTVMGLVPARAGSIVVNGVDVTGRRAHAAARAGLRIVPQGRRVFSSLTVVENLAISASRARDKGNWTLERVWETFPGLQAREKSLARNLSGGEQEMLALARALVGNPTAMLLDEPSDGLAPRVVDTVAEILTDLRKQGLSGILVEQNLKLAVAVADRILCLVRGEIAWRGSTEEFRRQPEVASRLLGAVIG